MNGCSIGLRVRCLILALAAAGALAALLAALPALAAEPHANTTPAASADGDASKALAKLDDDWSKAAATRDAGRVASFYAEDAIAYPPNEPAAIGRAAAQRVWASFFADPGFTISWTTLHAGVSKSGDVGYTTGVYEAAFKGADGKAIVEKGKYVCVWAKQRDGSWKAVHDIWNADAK